MSIFRKYICFVFALISSVFLVGCGNTYKHKDPDFLVQTPEGWEINDTILGLDDYVVFEKADPNGGENLAEIHIMNSLITQGTSLQSLQTLPASSSISVIEQTLMAGGGEAICQARKTSFKNTFQCKYAVLDDDGQQYNYLGYYLVDPDWGITVVLATAEDPGQYSAALDQIITSLKRN